MKISLMISPPCHGKEGRSIKTYFYLQPLRLTAMPPAPSPTLPPLPWERATEEERVIKTKGTLRKKHE
jgi:hypothetical protein